MLKDIGEYLEAEGVGTLGKDIFLGLLPDTPDTCVVLYEYAGSPPDLHWNGEYPGLHIKVRANDYVAVRAKVKAVSAALHGLYETILNDTRYLLIKAKGSPEVFDRDEKDRIIMFINFDIMKEAN